MERYAGTNTGERDEKTAKQTCIANLETSQATSAGNSKSFDSCTCIKKYETGNHFQKEAQV